MAGNGISAEQAVEEIKGSGGYVTVVAGRLNVSRQHVYTLIKKYKTVADAIQDEREKQKDYAEGKLQEQIKAGNMTAIIFYLKTQAKARGYVERVETDQSGEITVTLKYDDQS